MLMDIESTDWWRRNRCRVLSGYRLKHGMTQRRLAELTGISQNVISVYERGKREISLRAAAKLAKVFDISPEFLR